MIVNLPCLGAITKKNIGTYCVCLTRAHRSNRYEPCNRNKQLIYVAKIKGSWQKAFQTDYK